ncbi:MAG: hypothetical protein SPJ34_06450 [Candidatus Ornithospirochaeta sp.]|nr:hypothetical protein [Candidatus Ornithospirochaeta sp.]
MLFANDYAAIDGILRVQCISQKGIARRSDAFLFSIDDRVVLLDAGLPEVPYALASLLEKRASFLKGHEELLEKKDVKLRITWIASHMHIDHIGAFMESIASCPYIYVEKAYLPPRTSYFDPELSPDWDGDYKYRDRIAEAFRSYQGDCQIIDIPFRDEGAISFSESSSEFVILPPVCDWGEAGRADLCRELYAKEQAKSLPISITNANSLWLLIRYCGRSFLFTGDSMKKTERSDESFDMMLERWGSEIGRPDAVKYPHHGILRDEAARGVLSLDPDYVIYNAIDTTADSAIESIRKGSVRHVRIGYSDALFTVMPSGDLSLEGGV